MQRMKSWHKDSFLKAHKMFKENIVIVDTDTLSPELLELSKIQGTFSLVFLWDEDVFTKRSISKQRQSFIYEALSSIQNAILIQGNSQMIVEYLQSSYPNATLFYASRFQDRFHTKELLKIEMKNRVTKINPLPRGFFSFYKKLCEYSN